MLLQLKLNTSKCHGTNERIQGVLLHLVYKRHETSKASGNHFKRIEIHKQKHISKEIYTLEWTFPRFRTEIYNQLTCVNCLISLKEEAFVFHSFVVHEKNEVKVCAQIEI